MTPNTTNGACPKSQLSVLVVDDSLFMRTLIADLLRASPEIATVETASSGSEALRKMAELNPDCVMLDLMMPGMDGLTTLKLIMTAYPTSVIVISAYGREGTEITHRCRAAGAVSFIPKPSGAASLDIETIEQRLIEEVRKVAAITRRDCAHRRTLHSEVRPDRKLIALGASTGGQETLERIIGTLSPDLPASLLVVQHAPDRSSTESLTRRLNNNSPMPVKIIDDGEFLHGGVVYLAPGGTHVSIETHAEAPRQFRDGVSTNARFSVRQIANSSLSPSIDMAMKSAADAFRSNLVGVILTGIGNDGVEGMRAIRAAGGRTIAQDQSAMTLGMPQAVIAAGLADEVLSTDQIARAIDLAGRYE